MRVFALSDLHVDHEPNARWLAGLSRSDYRDDVLIVAGDVSHSLRLLRWTFETLVARYRKVLFVPGNHELWVDEPAETSLQKFDRVLTLAADCGVGTTPYYGASVSVFPLLGWYDYTFGQPSAELRSRWADFHHCRWLPHESAAYVTAYFTALNVSRSEQMHGPAISFSHFLPRSDLLPSASHWTPLLKPVMGTSALERQIGLLRPLVHVYGHSHFNQDVTLDGIRYVNNAFGYAGESHIARRGLLQVHGE